ncbi:unnamed protein product [Pedinophyceae sp. YPF-701]|nr:unnamed protein product [Pedinophyceae sp. YPF-701]
MQRSVRRSPLAAAAARPARRPAAARAATARLGKPGLPHGAVRPRGLQRRDARVFASSEDATKEMTPPKQANGSSSGSGGKREGPSTDLRVILARLRKLVLPYFTDPSSAKEARLKLAGVVALTLATTGVSVAFNFLGRDFFNALSTKDVDKFYHQLVLYLAGFGVGIPVFVFKDYFQGKLALDWRRWETNHLLDKYLDDRSYYKIQQNNLVDNPDQRLTSDVASLTETSLALFLVLLNSVTDLVSFSSILFSIYPPLFVALIAYSLGGTGLSLYLGRPLVGLNFLQETREADLRYGLVRVRENAESVAFYGGERVEGDLLKARLGRALDNLLKLLGTSRNLSFFTSFYKYLIILLPAAVVSPLYFRGEIEFGVINQSSSAFSHILNDVSLIVYQLEALAGFSAVIDRLGEFTEALDDEGGASKKDPDVAGDAAFKGGVSVNEHADGATGDVLLRVSDLSLAAPGPRGGVLMRDLSFEVQRDRPLLVMGPSGAGKTSLLRALAGLWTQGSGDVDVYGKLVRAGTGGAGGVMFVPQKPYLVLGSLRDQLLYPVWDAVPEQEAELLGQPASIGGDGAAADAADSFATPPPSDGELVEALRVVGLEKLIDRHGGGAEGEAAAAAALAAREDWSSMLSLGEQQRLAFARIILARPSLVLMDESTSALDPANEARMYAELRERGVTFVSVGHRPSLRDYHADLLVIGADKTDESEGEEASEEPVAAGAWTLSSL